MTSPLAYIARTKNNLVKVVFKAVDELTDGDRFIRFTYKKNGYHNPDYRFGKEQINFIHLPKTGGTSFCRLLENDPENRFAHLHIHKPISAHCPPGDYKYVTIMRNPVDRVSSLYQMVLRSKEGYPYQKWARQGLERYLDKCWATRNMLCRYLSAEVEDEPSESTFLKAQKNLGLFYGVLDFDNFTEEVSRFMEAYDIPHEQIPNERNHSYASPTEGEKDLIRQYNRWDVALFEEWKKGADHKNI
jgi:hypothetical protein